jgi:glycosyltransferase involved in cell wall biosynthesis
MKLLIGIDGGDFRPGNQVKSGIQRIADAFLKYLPGQYQANYYYFSNSHTPLRRIRNIRLHQLPQRFFASFHLPFNLFKDRNQVFLGLSSCIPPLVKLPGIKTVSFFYDLSFPKNLKPKIEYAVLNADKIVVLSEYAKNILLKNYSIDPNKVAMIYAGIDHITRQDADMRTVRDIKKEYGDFLLYVGVIKPSKNIAGLLRIFKKNKLVLIGHQEKDYFKSLKKSSRSIFLENISDKMLINYYLAAKAVVNLSHSEGFCFPVLEALGLGKPVIVNNVPLYREYVQYFKHLYICSNNKEIVSKVNNIGDLKSVGKTKIHQLFTWKHFIKEFEEIIRMIS